MENITREEIRSAIRLFVMGELESKEEISNKIVDEWIESKYKNFIQKSQQIAAERVKIVTHISKGIHSSSAGDDVDFKASAELPKYYLGTQSISNIEKDIALKGSADGGPLIKFLNIKVKGYKIRTLLEKRQPTLERVFAEDQKKSQELYKLALKATESELISPFTTTLNKQILWPLDHYESLDSDHYHCIVPLHPSALTYELYKKIRKFKELKWSKENQEAQNNRFDSTIKAEEQKQYSDIVNELASIKIVQSQPQNVSSHLNNQRDSRAGINYLLPSLSPQLSASQELYILRKDQATIFDRKLYYHCQSGFDLLFDAFKLRKNNELSPNRKIKDQEQDALDQILMEVIHIAKSLQAQLSGWSKQYSNLRQSEKKWLDLARANEDNDDGWIANIQQSLTGWIAETVRTRFPKESRHINDPEVLAWGKIVRQIIKASQYRKEGVFK